MFLNPGNHARDTPQAAVNDGQDQQCLRCRHSFARDEIERAADAAGRFGYIQCPWCEANNELSYGPPSPSGRRTNAVVVRIVNRGKLKQR